MGHEEKTEFESWNCIGSDHNIWLRIMVTHGCCKRQTVQGEIHNIQQKSNFQTHGIEEIQKKKIKFEIMYTFIKDYENCEKLSSDNKT